MLELRQSLDEQIPSETLGTISIYYGGNMLKRFFSVLFAAILLLSSISSADEGLWPISEIHKLDLQSKGLEIKALDIYNPEGISLIDGICKVNGCTGSFVSPQGLIVTNHHCAYGAIRAASTEDHDYIETGFLAENKSQEIPAKGYTVRITESYRDVSEKILSAVNKEMELAERTKAIQKKGKEIVARTEKENPGKRAEVSEMFIGKTYVLFIYTYLKDIRLVYAPPRSIGEFGGETDNWVWPRHTGDFSFMRAYVAPDGAPAEYSSDNIPYTPKKHLKVAPDGVNQEDFVFILGYPGRTYRHRTSHFLSYEQNIRMPYVVDFYQWQIDLMLKIGENDRAIALKHLSGIKGLSNTEKNYRGKLIGLQRLNLVDKKREEEKALQNFIEADPEQKKIYGNVLSDIEKLYAEKKAVVDYELILSYLKRSCKMIYFGYTVYEASIERKKKDIEREYSYMDRNFSQLKKRLQLKLKQYYEETDKIILKEILMRASKLPEDSRIPAFEEIFKQENTEKAIDTFIEKLYRESSLIDEETLLGALEKSTKKLKKMKDPFIRLAADLYPTYKKLKKTSDARKGAIDKLSAKLIDIKKEFLATDFVPDANSTLRLTYGRIRGYSPKDAVYYNPITTTKGVLEKTTGEDPFDSPQKLIDLIKAEDYGRFHNKKLGGVPVAILYNMDTTGGNSGSPVLNARGEIVGINFDRAFEATINDYAWSEDYSRSIAVDIRYVLWVTLKYGNAKYLLDEMNVLSVQ